MYKGSSLASCITPSPVPTAWSPKALTQAVSTLVGAGSSQFVIMGGQADRSPIRR
jgi:hypothetical protein